MSARHGAAAVPPAALNTRTAARYPPISSGSSNKLVTAPIRSLGGSGLAVCTVTGWPSLCAAATNAGSSTIWAKKLFAGTTISVSLELPVTYAPYSSPRSIAVIAADWFGYPIVSSEIFEVTAATTLDGPTTPTGIFRGTSNCRALTRHSANTAWPTSTATSATTAFLVTSRLPGPAPADVLEAASCSAIVLYLPATCGLFSGVRSLSQRKALATSPRFG